MVPHARKLQWSGYHSPPRVPVVHKGTDGIGTVLHRVSIMLISSTPGMWSMGTSVRDFNAWVTIAIENGFTLCFRYLVRMLARVMLYATSPEGCKRTKRLKVHISYPRAKPRDTMGFCAKPQNRNLFCLVSPNSHTTHTVVYYIYCCFSFHMGVKTRLWDCVNAQSKTPSNHRAGRYIGTNPSISSTDIPHIEDMLLRLSVGSNVRILPPVIQGAPVQRASEGG